MAITRDDVRHIALLARLPLSAEEEAAFTEQLDHILAHFQRLDNLDTSAVEPTAHIAPMATPFRDDVGRQSRPTPTPGWPTARRATGASSRSPRSSNDRTRGCARASTRAARRCCTDHMSDADRSHDRRGAAPAARRASSPSSELTRAVLARIERTEPALHSFITVTPEHALAQARAADARLAAGDAPAAVRHPARDQGHHPDRRRAHHRRLEDPRAFVAPYDATVTRPPARRRRGVRRQAQLRRVRHGLVDRELGATARRAIPWDRDARARRLVGRLGRRGRRAPVPRRARHRHRRLDPPAGRASAASSA